MNRHFQIGTYLIMYLLNWPGVGHYLNWTVKKHLFKNKLNVTYHTYRVTFDFNQRADIDYNLPEISVRS